MEEDEGRILLLSRIGPAPLSLLIAALRFDFGCRFGIVDFDYDDVRIMWRLSWI